MQNVSQTQIYKALNIPPSKANIQVVGPIPTTEEVNTKFFQMGLTAADLTPIDWRKKATLSVITNQQDCGDCWAMSSTSALADRFIIQKFINNLQLEPAVTAQCAQPTSINEGCNGGQPTLAGQYFEQYGVPSTSDNCPQWAKICPGLPCKLPACNDMVTECKNSIFYKAVTGSTQNLTASNDKGIDIPTTIANIKRELINGPVVAAFFVPKDFMATGAGYKWGPTNGIFINGAYNDDLDKNMSAAVKQNLGVTSSSQWGDIIMEGASPAGHAVSVVGWDRGKAGKFGDVSYWIVRNSWGPTWNEGGYFRIAMNDGTGNNTNLGFDIPVSNLVIASTKATSSLGGLFGGCVKFDPDLNTGAPRGHSYSKQTSQIIRISIIVGIIILLFIIFYLYMKKYRR